MERRAVKIIQDRAQRRQPHSLVRSAAPPSAKVASESKHERAAIEHQRQRAAVHLRQRPARPGDALDDAAVAIQAVDLPWGVSEEAGRGGRWIAPSPDAG